MKRNEFNRICSAVKYGRNFYVENTRNHDIGKVSSCQGADFEVEASGVRQNWSRKDCRETEMSVR